MRECDRFITERIVKFAVVGALTLLAFFLASVWSGVIPAREDMQFILPLLACGYVMKGAIAGFVVAAAFPPRWKS